MLHSKTNAFAQSRNLTLCLSNKRYVTRTTTMLSRVAARVFTASKPSSSSSSPLVGFTHRVAMFSTDENADDDAATTSASASGSQDAEKVLAFLRAVKIDEKHAEALNNDWSYVLTVKTEKLKSMGLSVKERKEFLRMAERTRSGLWDPFRGALPR